VQICEADFEGFQLVEYVIHVDARPEAEAPVAVWLRILSLEAAQICCNQIVVSLVMPPLMRRICDIAR
jgi:hypothetical protein